MHTGIFVFLGVLLMFEDIYVHGETTCATYAGISTDSSGLIPVASMCTNTEVSGKRVIIDTYTAEGQTKPSTCTCTATVTLDTVSSSDIFLSPHFDLEPNYPNCGSQIVLTKGTTTLNQRCYISGNLLVDNGDTIDVSFHMETDPYDIRYCMVLSLGANGQIAMKCTDPSGAGNTTTTSSTTPAVSTTSTQKSTTATSQTTTQQTTTTTTKPTTTTQPTTTKPTTTTQPTTTKPTTTTQPTTTKPTTTTQPTTTKPTTTTQPTTTKPTTPVPTTTTKPTTTTTKPTTPVPTTTTKSTTTTKPTTPVTTTTTKSTTATKPTTPEPTTTTKLTTTTNKPTTPEPTTTTKPTTTKPTTTTTKPSTHEPTTKSTTPQPTTTKPTTTTTKLTTTTNPTTTTKPTTQSTTTLKPTTTTITAASQSESSPTVPTTEEPTSQKPGMASKGGQGGNNYKLEVIIPVAVIAGLLTIFVIVCIIYARHVKTKEFVINRDILRRVSEDMNAKSKNGVQNPGFIPTSASSLDNNSMSMMQESEPSSVADEVALDFGEEGAEENQDLTSL